MEKLSMSTNNAINGQQMVWFLLCRTFVTSGYL